jgi:murein DD-endopeptidase MepM/ murein hydrolase activator NlpD
VGLLCALVAASAAGASTDRARVVAQLRERARAYLEQGHMSPETVGLEELFAELDERAAGDEPPVALSAWLLDEIASRWLAFAPVAATPKASHRYQLPFDRRVHWIVGQGVSNSNHTGSNEFALDFAMPEGTEVLAARPGRVARVVDGFTRCCLPIERSGESNMVLVLHSDGSFAMYVHLRPGIPVKEGQRVKAGDLVGYSGNTGYSTMPHLHFQVSIRSAPTRFTSVPFRFANGTREGYLPKPWKLYENRPRPTAPLRVSIGGRQLVPGEPFLLADRAPAQLRVERMEASGGSVDVTRDPGTRYVALTPWSLGVDAGGLVAFGPSLSVWKPLPEWLRRNVSIVSILFRDPDGREGFFDAWLAAK